MEARFRGELGIGFGGRATYWFAEGVGVVKQVSEGSLAGRVASYSSLGGSGRVCSYWLLGALPIFRLSPPGTP
ncbi:hypothetical protein [uncultured Meiothermus sp.]|uniref:hypothetical protein n=1 Tax=uncultured Meiothermus sp. TaxID=157471 RepID=UPI002612A0C6|nr:hypothetical protein [uncultured Meiothermus sp.]